MLDRAKLVFGDNSPYQIVGKCAGRKLKFKLDVIRGPVIKINKRPCRLEGPLQKVVTWP